jgi:ferrous iron transport protein B
VRREDIAVDGFSDRVDRWLTHRVFGMLVALIFMISLFQAVFWIAEPASVAIDWLTGLVGRQVDQLFVWLTGSADGAFHSLLVDGLVAGVGSVLVFLPQILLLFFFLAILEDCGYLARLAFLADRYLSRVGLSGITLIPLLSSFACAIPGIMATRVIRDPRERVITILIAPLMSCSARLPVYVLLIGAFVPAGQFLGMGYRGLTLMAMYLIGIAVAIAVAWVLKKTVLSAATNSFMMECPSYKLPSLKIVSLKAFQGGASFARNAGTIIVAATIIVWAAAYFPRNPADLSPGLVDRRDSLSEQLRQTPIDSPRHAELAAELVGFENQIEMQYLESSFLGRAGRWIEPVVRPLGWDWRLGSAAIASFPARELVVSTMGVLFGLGSESDDGSTDLRSAMTCATWAGTDKKLFSLPVALSVMVFFALCAQCSSTLAVIKRETNSWRWPLFTFTYMTAIAYVAAFLTYQISRLIWI